MGHQYLGSYTMVDRADMVDMDKGYMAQEDSVGKFL